MQPILDKTVLLNFRSLERDGVLIVDELIRLFLYHTEPLLETIERSSNDPRTNTFQIALHRLKGSSASIGALRLAHMCEELEQLVAIGTLDMTHDIMMQMSSEYQRVREALEGFPRA